MAYIELVDRPREVVAVEDTDAPKGKAAKPAAAPAAGKTAKAQKSKKAATDD